MKNLLFMRHGKSSWEYNVGDQDRPLSQRGVNDAHLVASKLVNEEFNIDFICSSPANRALHTAMICVKELKFSMECFRIVPELYDFSGEQVLNVIKNGDDNWDTLLIFGHNHAFTHLVNVLGDKRIENVPTSGFVHIRFRENTWGEITQGETIHTIFPKHLKG